MDLLAAKKECDIVHKTSDVWGNIYVLDYYNHRVLTFDSIYEQSRMDKDSPFIPVHEYTQAMLLVLLFSQPKKVLLLGLGSGALLRSLHHLTPLLNIDAVELRQAVVDTAKKYFGLPVSDRINIHIDDADNFTKKISCADVDIIFADIYNAYDMDPLQSQVIFLEQCYAILSVNGWLVMNFHQLPHKHSNFMLMLPKLFKQVLVCKVPKGNFIIYACKVDLSKSLESYFDQLPDLELALQADLSSLIYRVQYL